MTILQIDRTEPFDPNNFIGGRGIGGPFTWKTYWEDPRSLELTELDLSKVQLDDSITCDGKKIKKLPPNLRCVVGPDGIRLDAKIFETLWFNRQLDIFLNRLEQLNNGDPIRSLLFDGTLLVNSYSSHYNILYFRKENDSWCRDEAVI